MFSPPSSSPPLQELCLRLSCSYPAEAGVAVFGETGREGPVLKCGFEGRVLNLAVGLLNGHK